jgi:DNA-binding ferritin-like protein (Dps family)
MGWRDAVERNVIIFMVGVAVSAGVVTAGVAEYFSSARATLQQKEWASERNALETKHRSELETLSSRVSSVERRLGNQRYLDVRTLFSAGGVPGNQPTGGRYHSDGGFFALSDEKEWAFSKTNELELISSLTDPAQVAMMKTMLPAFAKMMEETPVYLWTGGPPKDLNGTGVFSKVFPFIAVEKVKTERLKAALGEVAADFEKALEKDNVDSENPLVQFAQLVGGEYQSDAAGIFLVSQLNVLYTAAMQDASMDLLVRNIQKVGPVLYMQVVLVFNAVGVDQKPVEKLFIVKEYFLTATATELTAIVTHIPSEVPDFDGDNFRHVNLWLGSFRLSEL